MDKIYTYHFVVVLSVVFEKKIFFIFWNNLRTTKKTPNKTHHTKDLYDASHKNILGEICFFGAGRIFGK